MNQFMLNQLTLLLNNADVLGLEEDPQFVIEKVMEAAHPSTALSGSFGRNSLMNVNHIAHLSGALVGVFLVWIVSKVPSEPPSQEGSSFQSKAVRTRLQFDIGTTLICLYCSR
ncbi:hypothetical protein ACFX19_044059 [Malus domestica]